MSTPDHGLTESQQRLIEGLREDAVNRYHDGDLGALDHSVAFKPHDPAFALLLDGKTSTPVVHRPGCYICEDPEYAAMGLPLCYKCLRCGGHIAADDETCDDCGWCINPYGQTGADGLAPDGFEGLDPAVPDSPYGDFETREPFRVQTGVRYDGSPEWFGDWREPYVPRIGDYVEAGGGGGPQGTITMIEGTVITVRVEKMFGPPDPDPEIVCCRAGDVRFLCRTTTIGGPE